MAKSIRSKRKRMLRSIKRERYAVKEMIRLKKMLGIEDEQTRNPPIGNNTRVREFCLPPKKKEELEIEEEQPIMDINKQLDVKITEKGKLIVNVPSDDDDSDEENDVINVDAEMSENVKIQQNSTTGETEMEHSDKKVYNPKTMKDKSGRYPAWFRQKDIKRFQKKMKLKKKIEQKKEKLKEIVNKKKKSQKPAKKKRKGRTGKQSKNVGQSNNVQN